MRELVHLIHLFDRDWCCVADWGTSHRMLQLRMVPSAITPITAIATTTANAANAANAYHGSDHLNV